MGLAAGWMKGWCNLDTENCICLPLRLTRDTRLKGFCLRKEAKLVIFRWSMAERQQGAQLSCPPLKMELRRPEQGRGLTQTTPSRPPTRRREVLLEAGALTARNLVQPERREGRNRARERGSGRKYLCFGWRLFGRQGEPLNTAQRFSATRGSTSNCWYCACRAPSERLHHQSLAGDSITFHGIRWNGNVPSRLAVR